MAQRLGSAASANFCSISFNTYVIGMLKYIKFHRAEALYQNMKATYGVNACHLLQINSRSPSTADSMTDDQDNMPDPWSQFLTKKPSEFAVTI